MEWIIGLANLFAKDCLERGGEGVVVTRHRLSLLRSKVRAGSWVVLCCLILKERRKQTGLIQTRRWCDGGRLNWGAVAYGARVRPPG